MSGPLRFYPQPQMIVDPGRRTEFFKVVADGTVRGKHTADGLVEAHNEMRDVLAALLEWETQTGGWDAPCWRRAHRLMARLRKLEAA